MSLIRRIPPGHDTHCAPLERGSGSLFYRHVAPLGRKTGDDIALCSQNMFLIRRIHLKYDTHCAPLEREQPTYRCYRHTAPLERKHCYKHAAPLGRKADVDSSIEIRQYVSDAEDASGT